MKKNFVLFFLFIFPIVAYLFFASGVNGFTKLPIITKTVPEFNNWKTVANDTITLTNKITILGFTGTDINAKKGNFFNLNQKIYEKYSEFKDFQVVFIAPIGTEKQTEEFKAKIDKISNLSRWHYVFASPEEITKFYDQLQLKAKLDTNLGTSNVFIIDKARNVRGRKGKVKKGDAEYREGYSTTLVSELHNEMTDDVKIILAEYRLALKQNNAFKKIEAK
ncbi:MAG: hypothetical protein V4648_05370 [Bacteroidota bacterium]